MSIEQLVSYTDNGAISGEYGLIDGQLHGECLWYDESGNLVQCGHYQHGLLQGELRLYNNDELFSITQYHAGKKHGEQLIFNQRQQPACRMNYHNDALHGKAIWYDEAGQIIKLAHYRANQLHGKALNYIQPNQLYEKATYQYGKLHGYVIRYDHTGKPVSKSRYQTGKQIETNVLTPSETEPGVEK